MTFMNQFHEPTNQSLVNGAKTMSGNGLPLVGLTLVKNPNEMKFISLLYVKITQQCLVTSSP